MSGNSETTVEKLYITETDTATESTRTSESSSIPSSSSSGETGSPMENVKALEWKQKGNKSFSEGHFHLAIQEYTNAIEECETSGIYSGVHVYYSNRACCHIKLENFGSAIIDAEKAIELKPGFSKGHYRRGCAYLCLMKYKLALADFQTVCRYTSDPDAAARLKECQRQLRQQKFAEAISTDRSELLSKTISLETMPIEASYTGPIYDSAKVRTNPEFLKLVLEFLQTPGNVLHKKYAYAMVLDMITLLRTYGTIDRIVIPPDGHLTVCGDIHGQFYDLVNIFNLNGLPSESNPYLFNGDFVDRGSFSVECIMTLFAAKLCFPYHIHLARGNHESRNMNKVYGFEGEVTSKYDERLYLLFCECFCLLPLSHLINEKIFVVHGGLFSKDGVTLADIDKIDRNCEPPDEGLMTEMLWSDPSTTPGRSPSKRGVACSFGPDVTKQFLAVNKLDMIIRSHEMKEEGYEIEHDGKLITVFSAPNYCDQMGNKGAFIRFGSDLVPKFTKFEAVHHPPVKPMKYANPLLSMM